MPITVMWSVYLLPCLKENIWSDQVKKWIHISIHVYVYISIFIYLL